MYIDSNMERRLTFFASCHRVNRLDPTRPNIGFDNLSFVRIETSKFWHEYAVGRMETTRRLSNRFSVEFRQMYVNEYQDNRTLKYIALNSFVCVTTWLINLTSHYQRLEYIEYIC